MSIILIKSNQGNQSGFNRKWGVLNCGETFESMEAAREYLQNTINELENNVNPSFRTVLCLYDTGYSNDGHRYKILTTWDVETGFFDGAENGYINETIKSILNIK
jgi:hypothetical protein